MAIDDLTSAGHGTLEISPVEILNVPKSPPAVIHKHNISYDEAFGDVVLEELTPAQALDEEEELPWIALAKWRKGLVLAGYVFAFDTKYMAPKPNCFDSLFLGLFLSTLDTSIIATALVTIVTELNDFQRSPWVVVAYLLLYMSRSAWGSRSALALIAFRSRRGFC